MGLDYDDDTEPFHRPPLGPDPTEVDASEVDREELRGRMAQRLEVQFGDVSLDDLKAMADVGLFNPDLKVINLNRLSKDFRPLVLEVVITQYIREHPEGRTLSEIAEAVGLLPDRVHAILKNTHDLLPPVPVKVRRGGPDDKFFVYGWLYPQDGSGHYNEYIGSCQAGTRGDIASELGWVQLIDSAPGHEVDPKVAEMAAALFSAMQEINSAFAESRHMEKIL